MAYKTSLLTGIRKWNRLLLGFKMLDWETKKVERAYSQRGLMKPSKSKKEKKLYILFKTILGNQLIRPLS